MDEERVEREALEAYAKAHMTAYRFKHTLGVVETAIDLAVIYGVDPKKAAIAALLHDVAKELTVDQKRAFCQAHNIYVDDFLQTNIHLMHGAIGAHMAQEALNIQDEGVLKAITNHTLGDYNMSKLEKVVYIADLIEPNRKRNFALDQLREIAYTDLNEAMLFALNYSINYLEAAKRQVHPIIYSILKEYE